MAFQPVPGVVQCNIRWVAQGQQAQNTLYFRTGGGGTETNLAALADVIEQAYITYTRGRVATTTALTDIYFVDLEEQNGFAYNFPLVPQLAGTNGAGALPNNVSLAISFRTASRGRNARGRNYVVGMTEADVTGNDASGVLSDAWVVYYEAIQSGALNIGLEMCVVSRYLNKVKRPFGVTFAVTSILVVDNVVDSQRGRLPGRGN